MALEDMKKYYGMSGPDGNNLGNFIKSYYKQIQPSDRANASWTLQQMHREEVYRLYDFVRSRVPGWEIGQKFDTRYFGCSFFTTFFLREKESGGKKSAYKGDCAAIRYAPIRRRLPLIYPPDDCSADS